MADPSHPDPHQFRQTFSQFGPPVPYQSDQNAPQFQGTINQGGPPKIPGMTAVVPPPLAGQQFSAAPLNNYMSMQSQPHGHISSSQNINNGPQPPPVAGNINGFVAPVAGVRPPGLASALIAGQSQPGSFQPPVPGPFVTPPPSVSITNAAVPPQRMTLNGTAGTAPLARTPATSGRFPPPPLISQDGHSSGPQRPPLAAAYAPPPIMQGPPRPPLAAAYPPPPSMQGPPRFSMTEPHPPVPVSTGGSGPPSLSSASRTSGASTPVSGPMSSPNELPIPYHGQAQYSHQIGAASKLTPNPTPSNSEPPSQRSSRGPSPVNEQSYDALEGQFIQGQAATAPGSQPSAPAGTPAASLPPASVGAAASFPGPTTGAQVPYLPQQGQATPLPAGQRMPPPQRPGTQGAFTGQIHPPPRPGMQAPPMGQIPPPPRPGMQAPPTGQIPPPPRPGMQAPPMRHVPPPPTVNTAPFGQPVGQRYPQQIPGPRQPPPSDPLTLYQSGPPFQQPGPPPSGTPLGPYSLGPPVLPPPSQSPQGGYFQPPVAQQGMVGPPSGPTGVPSGPFNQPVQPNQGYPQPITGQNAINSMAGDFSKLGVSDSNRVINLMQEKKLIPSEGVETARPNVQHDHKKVNCNPEVFRCTLNAIPQTSALLNKARLPLGILIHPFKDLSQLPVIQSSVIVRCRSCRTYINPYVTFVDQRRWKCNLCFRINELPDEFSFDPVTKTYGDPQRRPEIRSATIEFIAPSEYMLRPPQPAVYLFVLDVSFNAIETGYLRVFTQTLLEDLDRLPGDARTQIGFLCFDSALYFFNLSEGLSQPQMLVVPDIEDVFLPCPDSLLVNLHECRDMVVELLNQLPNLFDNNHETGNALGTALQAAFKLVTQTGGRVTVMQTMLPTVGPGALENREATSQASSLNSSNLGPASDFYKKLALDCSAQQVAVDLFMLNGQYADIATISCISKYSAGCVHYYPSFHTVKNPSVVDKFESDLRRYITRKIGFESVMRIRCTRGVSIHTFHGNFFVRSTDLLSLPNVNPDAGFGMQMSIEENLTESSNVCFQAALLYTSSKGERRIRVHSLCVPITNQLSEVFAGADQQAIAALLAKMAVDRTISSSLEDARDAMINACQDMMNAFATQIPSSQRVGALMAPHSLRLMPLFTLAMLKSMAFRLSANIKVDDRVFAHLLAKTLPTGLMLQNFYPHLYPVHALNDEDVTENNGEKTPTAPLLQLSSANIDRHGVYIMDQGDNMYMLVGAAVSDTFCKEVFDVPNFAAIHDGMTDLPDLENATSERMRSFISHLIDSRPGGVAFCVIKEDSKMRYRFFHQMVEDRTENSMSYYEFLQFIQQKIKG